MLVAINGSQGSGKSTILKLLVSNGFFTVTRKTSRSIMSDWDVTLQEINDNPKLTIKFQHELVKRKLVDEAEAISSPDLLFTERTYADLFTYALVNLGKNNEYIEFLNDYYKECMIHQQAYSSVFFLTAGHFGVQHDSVRGSGQHYSTMVDLIMREYTERMTHPSRLCVVKTSDLTERVTMISQQSVGLHKILEQQ